ncbi:flagellar hook-length control protein FliK [Coralloluteibacterium thermophilus]|uniref:Flagellar hook-length control protein FliK n=1 Tax=Coralloluteibacterium thermophilum TaxID=2707049 RepID=A0ABV9NHA8_9GAMM
MSAAATGGVSTGAPAAAPRPASGGGGSGGPSGPSGFADLLAGTASGVPADPEATTASDAGTSDTDDTGLREEDGGWPPLWLTGLPAPPPAPLAGSAVPPPEAIPEEGATPLPSPAVPAPVVAAPTTGPAPRPEPGLPWQIDPRTPAAAAEPALEPVALALGEAVDATAEAPDETLRTFLLHPTATSAPRTAAAVAVVPGPPVEVAAEADMGGELGTRLQWMADQRIGHAEIRLNPADLGPVEVRLRLDGDRLLAEFSSTQAEVRQAIEQSLPRLREQLGQAGLQLAHAGVGDGARQDAPGDGAPRRTADAPHDASEPAGATAAESATPQTLHARGLLDAYA